MTNKNHFLRILNTAMAIAVILAYVVGIVFMIAGKFSIGVNLWAISTIVGALILYIRYKQNQRARDLEEEEQKEREYQARKGKK